MNHVVVIEALGKVSKIAHLFRQRGETVLVVATNGHLFDIPKETMSVDLSSFKITEWEVKNPERFFSLKAALERADMVTVLTDGDVEGEVIAAEIYPLIPENTKVIRAKLSALTSESLDEALLNATSSLDQNLVSQGLSRRITDRVVGYAFQNKSGRSPAIGRVVTPVLSSILGDPLIAGHIEINLGGDRERGSWLAKVPFTANEQEIATSLAQEASTLPRPKINSFGVKSCEQNLLPYNLGDALYSLSERFGVSIEQTQEALQSLYMQGRLTYIRTSSHHINGQSAARVGRLASEQAEHLFSASRLADSGGGPHGPHDALSPTGDVWLGRQLGEIPFEEQCLVAITRRLIESGQSSMLHVERGQMQPDMNSDKWNGIRNRLSLPMTIERQWRAQPPYAATDHWDGDRAIAHRGKPARKFGRVSLYLIPVQRQVLDRMRGLSLAQPSTLAKFSQTISRRFLNANGALNGRSFQALSHARQNIPELLNLEKVREMDQCFEDKSLQASDRARAALGKLNIHFSADEKSLSPEMDI